MVNNTRCCWIKQGKNVAFIIRLIKHWKAKKYLIFSKASNDTADIHSFVTDENQLELNESFYYAG